MIHVDKITQYLSATGGYTDIQKTPNVTLYLQCIHDIILKHKIHRY